MEHFLHAAIHAAEHSFLHTIQMFIILFAVYLIIVFFEGKIEKWQHAAVHFRHLGPLAGALVGCIPQCGFSAASASLYSKGFITSGTLIAVFLSTSDEAIPVMLASPDGWKQILSLLAAKLVIAILFGYLLDLTLFRREKIAQPQIHDHNNCHDHGCSCGCSDRFRSPALNILWKALSRTVHVSLFIMVTLFFIELAFHLIGTEQLNRLLLNGSVFQPLLTALIGLIPGCAISVLLTELFLAGNIGFGAAVAGLATGAGVGLLVLARETRSVRVMVKIMSITYVCAAVSGIVITLIAG